MMKSLPFVTNNTPLATALVVSGFRLHFRNSYDAKLLERLGCLSVQAARLAGRPGRLHYGFERVPGFDDALKAWNDAEKRFDAGEDYNPDDFRDESDTCRNMRFAAFILNTRHKVAELWKTAPASLDEAHGGTRRKISSDGTEVITFPRMTSATENISEPDRQHLEV